MITIVEINKNGKIELSKDELQKLLDEAYENGKKQYMVITYRNYPTINPMPQWVTTTC